MKLLTVILNYKTAEMTTRSIEAALRELAPYPDARVVVVDMNEEKGEAAAKELGGRFVKADVSSESEVQAAVASADAVVAALPVARRRERMPGASAPTIRAPSRTSSSCRPARRCT